MTENPSEPGDGQDQVEPAAQAMQQAAAPQPPKSGPNWSTIIVAAIAIAAIAGLGIFLAMTLSAKGDAEAALAQAQQDADEAEDKVEEVEDDLDQIRSQLDAANSEAADARARADEALARIGELESRAADADRMDELVFEFFVAASIFASGASPSQSDCVVASMVSQVGTIGMLEGLVSLITNPFLGDPLEDEQAIAMDACGVEAAPDLQPGHTYGDNPDLDLLWDSCAAGDGAACDTLYAISEIGSEYERFGGTCGDRYPTIFDAPLYCEGEI